MLQWKTFMDDALLFMFCAGWVGVNNSVGVILILGISFVLDAQQLKSKDCFSQGHQDVYCYWWRQYPLLIFHWFWRLSSFLKLSLHVDTVMITVAEVAWYDLCWETLVELVKPCLVDVWKVMLIRHIFRNISDIYQVHLGHLSGI